MALVSVHPFKAVKVMFAVPEETAVTTPDVLTMATVASEVVHGLTRTGVDAQVKVVVNPSQSVNVPVTVGNAFMVTVCRAVHPFTSVKIIEAVPTAIPVTVPTLFTVATKLSEDAQALIKAGAEALDNVVVPP